MLTTHATGSATASLIASCSFVFRAVDFIIDDFFEKKRVRNSGKKNLGQFLTECSP